MKYDTFFKFLDNKFRNLSLDSQIEFSLAKDGFREACHFWVLNIRKFFKFARIVTLPFEYALLRACIIRPDVDYETRYEETKAASEKLLAEARRLQTAGEDLPADPSKLSAPESAGGTGQTQH